MHEPRVLLVSHYFSFHKGGIELVVENVVRATRGVSFTWAATGRTQTTCDMPGVTLLGLGGSNLVEALIGFPYPLLGPGGLLRLFLAVRRNDVVHVHGAEYAPSIAASVFAALLGKPLVVTQHTGLLPLRSRALQACHAALLALACIVHWKADWLCFVSEKVRREFDGIPFFRRARSASVRRQESAIVVENGVDSTLFRLAEQGERAKLRRSLDLAHEARIVLFVGRFVEKKGLDVIRRIAKRDVRSLFLIAGWGPLHPAAWGLENVKVVDAPSHAKVAELYRAADVFLLPSRGEGFPLVLQEALAAGLRVVTSNENKEALRGLPDDVVGLDLRSEETVHEQWASAIELAEREDITGGAGEAPQARRAFAISRWSWGKTAARYADCYKECLKEGHRRD